MENTNYLFSLIDSKVMVCCFSTPEVHLVKVNSSQHGIKKDRQAPCDAKKNARIIRKEQVYKLACTWSETINGLIDCCVYSFCLYHRLLFCF